MIFSPKPRLKKVNNRLLILPAITLAAVLTLPACSSARPRLYPNQKYKTVGKAAAEADIERCEEEAEAFLDSPRGRKIVKGAGSGALLGGAVGAVAGIFTGDVGRGAAVGAATGGTAGAASGAMSPDEVKIRYINKCLSKKGYEVIGWD